jgi:hypothetical protein
MIFNLRFLIGWNDAIFDTFVPVAWAKMLQILVDEDGFEDIWSAWPSPSTSGQYWATLTSDILEEVISSHYRVFPVRAGDGASSCISLASSLVASTSDDPSLLDALVHANIPIVQPPDHVFRFLKAKDCQRLDPSTVHLLLSNHVEDVTTLEATDRNVLLDYLLLSSSLDNIFGLPLIPLFNGTYATLGKRKHNSSSKVYFLASPVENDLFGEFNQEMVALSHMSTGVQQVLCDPKTSQITNVAMLDKSRVYDYLCRIFGQYDPALDEVVGTKPRFGVAWLASFWSWMDTWPRGPDLLPSINCFHLLPTTTGILRKVQSCILLSTDIASQDITALKQLGVQFLHPSLGVSPSSFLVKNAIGKRADDIDNILRHIPSDIPTFDQRTASVVQNHFIRCIQGRQGNRQLAAPLLRVYRELPIFPILVPNPVTGGTDDIMGPAQGKLVYVNAKPCPLPLQPSVTYVDISKRTRALALLINPKAIKDAADEIMIFESAISCLERQPRPLLDSIVSRIIPRFWDLSNMSKKRLQNSRFVPALGSSDLFSPCHIIEPKSELEPLFRGESGKFPDKSFHKKGFWEALQSLGFFQKSLTHELVSERISYISMSPDSLPKARLLLSLLDKAWGTLSISSFPSSAAWLPATWNGDRDLYRADQCRDITDNRYLFDLVLPIVHINLLSPGLRAALGWAGDIPFWVIRSQLRQTLTYGDPSKLGDRLIVLIKYMASLYAKRSISDADIEDLRKDIGDSLWIPITSHKSVPTRHAVLSSNFEEVGSFKIVPRSLRETNDTYHFLGSMGCTEL